MLLALVFCKTASSADYWILIIHKQQNKSFSGAELPCKQHTTEWKMPTVQITKMQYTINWNNGGKEAEDLGVACALNFQDTS